MPELPEAETIARALNRCPWNRRRATAESVALMLSPRCRRVISPMGYCYDIALAVKTGARSQQGRWRRMRQLWDEFRVEFGKGGAS